MSLPPPHAEWLEPDGLGGFASGTVSLVRTRRYHALLLAATRPPTGRFVLLNGFDAEVETAEGARIALTTQRYEPGVDHPDGASRLRAFALEPWPTWTWALPGGGEVTLELLVPRGAPAAALRFRAGPRRGPLALVLRPFLSGRDFHSLHHENAAFRFDAEVAPGRVAFRPYPDLPGVTVRTNGAYAHAPDWYRRFRYDEEVARGLDHCEDLAMPGSFRWDLAAGDAVWIASAEGAPGDPLPPAEDAVGLFRALRDAEARRRRKAGSGLERAADAYLVRRGAGRSVVAGYPWFSDWGRDSFIALRGLALATGRLDEAREILVEWSGAVSEGMLPNRFPDQGEAPEYNSVDASLWYVVAVHDWREAMAAAGRRVARADRERLEQAVEAILDGYARGTRYGIRADGDGLLRSGEPGVQLTWMDARVGDRVVTPRTGKPVEIQALWINALAVGSLVHARWKDPLAQARESFARRFWNEAASGLHDVVDVDHEPGRVDASFRPNQVLAVGGLPWPVLEGERARRLVDSVHARLWTPLGLRSLAPGEPGYCGSYCGGVPERDGAYHQGTVWPWLAGPFVEAWVRVRGGTARARREARSLFLAPLLAQTDRYGLGHLPEIADAEPPHAPRGCPFQAWSVGEALRLDRVVLERPEPRAGRGAA